MQTIFSDINTGRSFGRLSSFLILTFLNLFLLYSSALADERILSFHSDITVHQDATITVRETIKVRSEGIKIKRGIYRDFPTRYKGMFGNRYVVGFIVLNVLRDGSPEPYHIENISNGKRVYIGEKNTFIPPEEYTYTLVYKTDRQIGFFKDHDELYWNVTGNGWEFPIDSASATVALPGEASKDIISTDGYTGPFGAKGKDFKTSVDPQGLITFMTTKLLSENEGITIVVLWPKGFVVEPDNITKLKYFIFDNRGFLLIIFGILVTFMYYLVVWIKAGRDPEAGVIVTRYMPPDNMSPAVIRYIKEMGYDDKVFASAVINIAVKKHLKITEKGDTYRLQKTDGPGQPLAPEEAEIVQKLLGASSSITLERSNYKKIQTAIKNLRNYLSLKYEKLYFVTNKHYFVSGLILTIFMLVLGGVWDSIERGMLIVFLFICLWLSLWSLGVIALLHQVFSKWKLVFRKSKGRIISTGGAISITLFSIPFVGGELFGLFILWYSTSLSMLFFLIVAVIINYLFYQLLKAPTRAGRTLLDSVEGFKKFLVATEKDRLNMLNPPDKTPELFEKYLPYALALDVEQEWADQFSEVLSAFSAEPVRAAYSPAWYSGASFSSMAAGDFASSLGSSLSGSISSSSTAPGSSSGSGGGSSGGGGGGGGGGGW